MREPVRNQDRRNQPDPYATRNIEELNDDEIYAAIRYLEPDPRSASNQRVGSSGNAAARENDDSGTVICVCLYIAVLGCLAVFWLYLR
jgi:hypothetical protein